MMRSQVRSKAFESGRQRIKSAGVKPTDRLDGSTMMLKSKTRSEELRLVAAQATELLDESGTMPKGQEERLNWLMESPLHVREALAATAWDEEIRQLLDPDRRIDADALVAKASGSNLIPVGVGRPTDVIPSDEEGIPPGSKRTD